MNYPYLKIRVLVIEHQKLKLNVSASEGQHRASEGQRRASEGQRRASEGQRRASEGQH